MKHKFVYIYDGEYYYEKEINGLIPLGTSCSFDLTYKDQISLSIFCSAYQYYYNIDTDTLDIRFGETDNEDGFEQEWNDMLKLHDIIHSDDFESSELKVSSMR